MWHHGCLRDCVDRLFTGYYLKSCMCKVEESILFWLNWAAVNQLYNISTRYYI